MLVVVGVFPCFACVTRNCSEHLSHATLHNARRKTGYFDRNSAGKCSSTPLGCVTQSGVKIIFMAPPLDLFHIATLPQLKLTQCRRKKVSKPCAPHENGIFRCLSGAAPSPLFGRWRTKGLTEISKSGIKRKTDKNRLDIETDKIFLLDRLMGDLDMQNSATFGDFDIFKIWVILPRLYPAPAAPLRPHATLRRLGPRRLFGKLIFDLLPKS